MSVLDSFRKKSSLDTFRKQKTPEEVFATPQAPQATQQLTPEQTLAAQQQVQQQGVANQEPALGFSPQFVDDASAYVRREYPIEGDPVKDYFSAVEGAVAKRGQELAETERDYQEGKITTPEYIMQTAGKGVFGTAADVGGETLMAGAKMLTPEFIESRVAELASAAAEGVMTSDQWKWAKNHWDEFSPRARKNLESALNIGFGVAAFAGKVPTQGVGKKMSVKGMAMRRERIAKQVMPDTPTARQKRALNPQLAAAEDRMVNTLMSVKGISHTKSPLENFKILNKELDSIDNTMRKSLSKHSNQTMNRNSIQAKVNNTLDALQKTDPGVYADKSLKQVYDRMNRLLFDTKTGYIKPTMTPVEILQARRNLDAAIKKLAGGATDQSKIFIEAGAQGDIIRAYRNALNDIIDAIPTDIDTKALRGRSSDLLMARKNYGRLADEKTASIMDMIERHPLASMATIRTGSSSLPILGGAIRGAQAINRAMPDTLVGTGNILQSPVGAAPAASLFYTDKENQQ
jgi:hypothetical protein